MGIFGEPDADGALGLDAELNLLQQLLADCPEDANDFIRPLPVSAQYAEHPRTICSVQENWEAGEYSQSRLGFLNQCREARGVPRIACVLEDGRVTAFQIWEGS